MGIALAVVLVAFVAAHVALVVGLGRRDPWWRAIAAVAVPPLAPWWGWRSALVCGANRTLEGARPLGGATERRRGLGEAELGLVELGLADHQLPRIVLVDVPARMRCDGDLARGNIHVELVVGEGGSAEARANAQKDEGGECGDDPSGSHGSLIPTNGGEVFRSQRQRSVGHHGVRR
jgi:hypothetical protein